MTQLYVNDQPEQTAAPDLLLWMEEKGLVEKKAIALALNEEVIPKSQWALTPLEEGDRILVIRATQGG